MPNGHVSFAEESTRQGFFIAACSSEAVVLRWGVNLIPTGVGILVDSRSGH